MHSIDRNLFIVVYVLNIVKLYEWSSEYLLLMLSVLEIISKYNCKGHLPLEITEIIKLPSNLFSNIIKNEIKNYKLISKKNNTY
jgi:hypothetical protein